MARVFVSHAGRDNVKAIALRQWLIAQHPQLAGEIFLDVDPDSGIPVGQRWRDALRAATARTEIVICLVSPHWQNSHECQVEYRTAESLGKRILVVVLEPLSDRDITREWQRCDVFDDGGPSAEILVAGHTDPVVFRAEGLRRLLDGLDSAGISAEYFPWPPPGEPDRSPYRGWRPFEAADAAVFFGRDAQIVRGMDVLRTLRDQGPSLVAVLGPSGAGKSSFLRAGLLPRLARDSHQFLPLDVVRPERAALTGTHGLAVALHRAGVQLGLATPPLGLIKQELLARTDGLRERLHEIQRAASGWAVGMEGRGSAPTIILSIDQSEELLGADTEALRLLELVAELIDPVHGGDELSLIVVITIRTDRLETLQTAPQLAGVPITLFDELKPMPRTRYQEVITGPAARATEAGRALALAPDLVEQLLVDSSEGGDALPLLGLTLAQLYRDYRDTKLLTLQQYRSLGGLGNVVQSEVESLLVRDPAARSIQMSHLRSAFIPWLITINPENDQPMRRIARWDDLPVDSHPIVNTFVERHLLVVDTRDGDTVVEVALESLLRHWSDLAGWLREDTEDLKAVDALERAAFEWTRSGRSEAWLLRGRRLVESEILAAKPVFRRRLAHTREYLQVSRSYAAPRGQREPRQPHIPVAEVQAREHRLAAGHRAQRTARIFLSYSRVDRWRAFALKQWLIEQQPGLDTEIYLDLDPTVGLVPGEKWEAKIRRIIRASEAMICLTSPHWAKSTWCQRELEIAEGDNKRLFCVRLKKTEQDSTLRQWHRSDLFGPGPKTRIATSGRPLWRAVSFATDGLSSLLRGLTDFGFGLSTDNFAWPPENDPDRSPYRGLNPLEADDAAIMFGRDAEIARGLADLRAMRESRSKWMYVVTGPSGAGKSSFLRAGLWPRLTRDREFVAMDVLRPERDAIDGPQGFAEALWRTRRRLGFTGPALPEIKAALPNDVRRVHDWLAQMRQARSSSCADASSSTQPTVVVPIDQAEELFVGANAGLAGSRLLTLLTQLATMGDERAPLIVAMTIRTDRYGMLENAPELRTAQGPSLVTIEPMSRAQFKEVITGPAIRTSVGSATLSVDPELVEVLYHDTDHSADSLPLLALTLSRMYERNHFSGTLTVRQYREMGAMYRVVQNQIDELLDTDPAVRGRQVDALMSAFIPWLVTIDNNSHKPIRRIARWEDLPIASRALINTLIEHRLLVKDNRNGDVTVQVASEILLRYWDELAERLRGESNDLKTTADIEQWATIWAAQGHRDPLLLDGHWLQQAETVAAKLGYRDRLRPTLEYLRVSRERAGIQAAAARSRIPTSSEVGRPSAPVEHSMRGRAADADAAISVEVASDGTLERLQLTTRSMRLEPDQLAESIIDCYRRAAADARSADATASIDAPTDRSPRSDEPSRAD